MNRVPSSVFACAAVLLVAACREWPAPVEPTATRMLAASRAASEHTGRHIVLFAAERVPTDFAGRVAGLGGSVDISLDNIGVAAVSGLTESAAADLAGDAGIQSVELDPVATLPHDDVEAAEEVFADATAAPASPTSAPFYPRQWNMRAVFADQAWAAGYIGSNDVVVGILDTGIDYLHPELAGLVDLARSKSFVPDEDVIVEQRYPGRNPVTDLLYHGTAVASIVASNATQLSGINRHITLLALKVANRFTEHTVAADLAAIVWAADAGADVINASGGRRFDKSENPGLIAAYLRALNYAWREGVLTIGVAGNDTLDHDHDGDMVALPCEAPHAICASATGPTSAQSVNGPWDNVDAATLYTGFGRSAVSVAAPGGQRFTNTRIWLPCLTTPSEVSPAACQGNKPPRLLQGIGTSFAAPTVAGLAALLVAQLGHGNPALIRERILQSADDLGLPGTDPYYGRGRINVARALGVIP
jgi:lantibiotic leader peptide-processing serine protease